MTESGLTCTASEVPERLRARPADRPFDVWLSALLRGRSRFGITRVGCVTRLDRVGIPVVQVVRPLALSNAVTQGKGTSLGGAAASGVMEAIETWAGERLEPDRSTGIAGRGRILDELYAEWLHSVSPAVRAELPCVEGWDLLSGRSRPVPFALVDTRFVVPSPHEPSLPRITTGLGAGRTLARAVLHGSLEVLERDAVARAREDPHFFGAHRAELPRDGVAAGLIERIAAAGLVCGLWRVPAPDPFPVYLCHLMETETVAELVPLPSEGAGCDFTHDGAVSKAILEAAQARVTAIAGAREDITGHDYPESFDRPHLAGWRRFLESPDVVRVRPPALDPPQRVEARLELIFAAFRAAGARAVMVVPLLSDEDAEINVARVVAPPLRLDPRG